MEQNWLMRVQWFRPVLAPAAQTNRAFKRKFSLPPAQYRCKLKGKGAGLRAA